MALSLSDARATFDDTTGHLDISPMLSAILVKDTATLGLLGGPSTPPLAVKHFWNEDGLNANIVTINEGAEFSDSDVTLTISDASKIRVGTLLKDFTPGKEEVMQVTAISGNDLTVVRGYQSTDTEVHADGAELLIVGQPLQQGDETITDISNARSQKFNYMQEFKKTVKITDQMQAEAQNGIHPGITSEFDHQIMLRLFEMMVELNTSVIHGIRSDTPSDTVYGSMGGFKEFIDAAGGNTTSVNGGLTEAIVNTSYKQAWDDGGSPSVALGNRHQITKFSTFNNAKLRVAPSDRVAGTFVNKFLTDMGRELDLVTDRWFGKDELALLDVSGQAMGDNAGGVNFAPMKGRELQVEPLARIGNARRAMITGGWTVEVRNALKAHAWIKRLTVPA